MSTALEELIRSPQLVRYYEQIRDLLVAEQQRRAEFYAQIDEERKVEFINGQMIFQSPVKLRHNNAARNLLVLLSVYSSHHQLGLVGFEKLLVTLTRNDYEPDICFFTAERAAEFSPDQMQFPAPDFVAEVLLPSTEAIDRGVKFADYAAHGVGEYWLIDPDTQTLEQFVLEGEAYSLLTKARSGEVSSTAIPGFSLPIRALFDPAEHARALQRLAE